MSNPEKRLLLKNHPLSDDNLELGRPPSPTTSKLNTSFSEFLPEDTEDYINNKQNSFLTSETPTSPVSRLTQYAGNGLSIIFVAYMAGINGYVVSRFPIEFIQQRINHSPNIGLQTLFYIVTGVPTFALTATANYLALSDAIKHKKDILSLGLFRRKDLSNRFITNADISRSQKLFRQLGISLLDASPILMAVTLSPPSTITAAHAVAPGPAIEIPIGFSMVLNKGFFIKALWDKFLNWSSAKLGDTDPNNRLELAGLIKAVQNEISDWALENPIKMIDFYRAFFYGRNQQRTSGKLFALHKLYFNNIHKNESQTSLPNGTLSIAGKSLILIGFLASWPYFSLGVKSKDLIQNTPWLAFMRWAPKGLLGVASIFADTVVGAFGALRIADILNNLTNKGVRKFFKHFDRRDWSKVAITTLLALGFGSALGSLSIFNPLFSKPLSTEADLEGIIVGIANAVIGAMAIDQNWEQLFNIYDYSKLPQDDHDYKSTFNELSDNYSGLSYAQGRFIKTLSKNISLHLEHILLASLGKMPYEEIEELHATIFGDDITPLETKLTVFSQHSPPLPKKQEKEHNETYHQSGEAHSYRSYCNLL